MTRTLTRALANLPQNIVSVKDFGAIGNGVADDTAGLLAAFAALSSNDTLVFPPGEYIMSGNTSLTINGLSNVTISGYGAKISITKDLADGGLDVFTFIDCRDITFLGLEVDYEVTAVATVGSPTDAVIMYMPAPTAADKICENLTWRDCKFRLENTSSSGTWKTDSAEGDAIPIPEGDSGGSYEPNGYKLEGFHFVGDYTNLWRHRGIKVESCVFDRMTARSFWMWACEDIEFINNTLTNVGARRPQIRIITSNRNLRVCGNTFYSESPWGDTTTIVINRQNGNNEDPDFVAGVAEISNNTFYYDRGRSIEINGFKDVAITGNVFKRNPNFDSSNFDATKFYKSYSAIEVTDLSRNDVNLRISIAGNTMHGENLATRFLLHQGNSYNTLNQDISIVGNTISDTGSCSVFTGAIVLGTGNPIRSVTVSSNTFSDCNVGVYVSQVEKSTICANTFNGTTLRAGNGIQIGSGSRSSVLISSNQFTSLNWGIYATSSDWPGSHLIYGYDNTGSFSPGDTLTGGTSGATATVSTVTTYSGFAAGTPIGTNRDRTISFTLTGTPGVTRFICGETVTATSGGTFTSAIYSPLEENLVVKDNYFHDCTGGIRNFNTSKYPLISNSFYNVITEQNDPTNPSAVGNYTL